MSKIKIIFILTISIISLAFLPSVYSYFQSEGALDEKYYSHVIDFFSESYQVEASDLMVTESHYSEGHDRYAVTLVNKQNNETIDAALRVDEKNQDLAFVLDVTGTYDDFGIAYCH